jgi:AhpD family alkylhydroperoxidase
LMIARKSRCRSRLPELAHEVTTRLNHDVGSIRTNLEDMTQTLETQLAANKRLKIYKSSPELLDAMMALSTAAAKDVDAELGELIKIRASQINHCAFCLNMHLVDARKQGISEQKLDVLAAWEEAGALFSERERAALALTEAITDVPDGVPDDVYAQAAAVFDDRELGQVIAMAVTINAWNRINVTVRTTVPRR